MLLRPFKKISIYLGFKFYLSDNISFCFVFGAWKLVSTFALKNAVKIYKVSIENFARFPIFSLDYCCKLWFHTSVFSNSKCKRKKSIIYWFTIKIRYLGKHTCGGKNSIFHLYFSSHFRVSPMQRTTALIIAHYF